MRADRVSLILGFWCGCPLLLSSLLASFHDKHDAAHGFMCILFYSMLNTHCNIPLLATALCLTSIAFSTTIYQSCNAELSAPYQCTHGSCPFNLLLNCNESTLIVHFT